MRVREGRRERERRERCLIFLGTPERPSTTVEISCEERSVRTCSHMNTPTQLAYYGEYYNGQYHLDKCCKVHRICSALLLFESQTFVPMMERMSEMTARTERETVWKTPGSLPSVYHFPEETVVP